MVRNPIIAKFGVSRKAAKEKKKGAKDFCREESKTFCFLPDLPAIFPRAFVPLRAGRQVRGKKKNFTQRRKG